MLDPVRIQLELPEAKIEELKVLMHQAGMDTYKELFNNALTLFEWAIDQTKAGRSLASVDEENDKYRVLVMPVLERVRPVRIMASSVDLKMPA